MNIEEALGIVDAALQPERLNDVQEQVFRQSWQGQSYSGMAEQLGYNAEYIKNVGAELWQLLSQALSEEVTKHNFKSVLRQRSLSLPPTASAPVKTKEEIPNSFVSAQRRQDWGEAPDVSVFYGRTEELSTLKKWITQERCRLVALLGMGGIGKTALGAKLAEQIHGEFEYVIWRNLRHAPPLRETLADLNEFLAQKREMPETVTLEAQISSLFNSLRTHRCLLILDDWETVLRDGDIAGYYRFGFEEYGQLLKRVGEERHQSCLLLMSREKPIEVASLSAENCPARTLQVKGLKSVDAKKLLMVRGFTGTENGVDELIQLYRGNPTALKMVATTILELFNGNIIEFVNQTTLFVGDIFSSVLDRQLERLSGCGKTIMYWLAIAGKPMSFSQLKANLSGVISSSELLKLLESIGRRMLIEKDNYFPSNEALFTLEPVVMKYVNNQFIEQVSQEIVEVLRSGAIDKLGLLKSHALAKASESLVRRIQERLWVRLENTSQMKAQLRSLLSQLRESPKQGMGYAEENILLLLGEMPK